MVKLLPSKELITKWLHAITNRDHSYVLREQAVNCYSPEIELDKELARSLMVALDWEKITYTPALVKQQFRALEHGCWLADITEAVERCPWLKDVIDQVIFDNSALSPLALLVATIYQRCSVVYIPAGTRHENISLFTDIPDYPLYAEQLIIVVEPEAQVTLHDLQKIGLSCTYLRAVSIIVGAHANVTLIHEQNAQQNICFSSHNYYLQKNARLTVFEGATNRAMSALWSNYFLSEERAEVEHTSVCTLKDQEQFALITKQHHKSKSTKSSITVKQVLQGKARAFYRGNITIDKAASGSEANQQHVALMLSSDARACAIPSLEIQTNDVRCQHGTAAGYLNQEQIWYLQSRGLEKNQAYKLIIDGFLQDGKTNEAASVIPTLIKRIQEHVQY